MKNDLSAAESLQAVVDAIRRAIMNDELAPGQRLLEAELCKSLDASRFNVRVALRNLSHEGLVEHITNRGARVRVIGLEEALHITEVRMAMEEFCVARAAERITATEIVELRAMAVELQKRAEQGDPMGFAKLTHQVHALCVRIADQAAAADVLARLRSLISRHRFRLTYRAGRAKVALPLWLARIDAVCQRDPEAARMAVQRHAENVKEAMRALVNERKPIAENSR